MLLASQLPLLNVDGRTQLLKKEPRPAQQLQSHPLAPWTKYFKRAQNILVQLNIFFATWEHWNSLAEQT